MTTIPILRYGHCNFTSQEVLAAFDLLVWQVSQKYLINYSEFAKPGGFFTWVCEQENGSLLFAILARCDGTLIADWDRNVLPLPQWSSIFTTHAFRFRALLTDGGIKQVDLVRV